MLERYANDCLKLRAKKSETVKFKNYARKTKSLLIWEVF